MPLRKYSSLMMRSLGEMPGPCPSQVIVGDCPRFRQAISQRSRHAAGDVPRSKRPGSPVSGSLQPLSGPEGLVGGSIGKLALWTAAMVAGVAWQLYDIATATEASSRAVAVLSYV